jgi:hypothetical protein
MVITLCNLARIYNDTERLELAEDTFQEAHSTCIEPLKVNPEVYLPNLSMT